MNAAFWVAAVLAGIVQGPPMVGCPVTSPAAAPFVPPAPYPEAPPEGFFWYGTPELWTRLPRDGRSIARDKWFWWSVDYSTTREVHPDLRITATSLATGFVAFMQPATNASSPSLGGWAMLAMLEVPSAGCWQVTATYREHSVTYVTLVPDR